MWFSNYWSWTITGTGGIGQSGGGVGALGTHFANVIGAIEDKKWFQIAWTRSGSTMHFFINGTLIEWNTHFGGTDIWGEGFYLGASKNLNSSFIKGYMDDTRLIKGEALWTEAVSYTHLTLPTKA